MDLKMDGTKLVIIIETAVKGAPSNSGKMTLLASTHGFTTVPGTDLKLSLNLGRKS